MSVPNGDTGTAGTGYTTYPQFLVKQHGPCPTCGKCQCCDDKDKNWYQAPYYQPHWVTTVNAGETT